MEIGNLAIAVKKIEGVHLVCGTDKDTVNIFLGTYKHSIVFDDEDESTKCYERVLLEMQKY